MDPMKRACCARTIGWSFVGVVIAVSWGIGNLANGMEPLAAFAIPGMIVLAIVGFVALAALNVNWFNRLCACPAPEQQQGSEG